MKRTIVLSLCLAFVASSVAFAFPFGMPPQENPMVTKVAPEDSGMFVSWQGIGAVDANSTNLVEQSLAKPEVKAQLKEVNDSILEKLGDHPLFAKFVELAMRNGASFYVSDAKASSFAGMIALGQDDLSAVTKLTASMNALSKTGKFTVSQINIGSLPFFKLTTGTDEKEFYWGAFGKGKVIVFANNESAIITILNNARSPEPNWVVGAKKDFNIKRLSTFSALLGDFIEDGLKQNAPSDKKDSAADDEAAKDLMGVSFVDKVVVASGLDEVGSVQKTAVYMKDGWKQSVPGVLFNKSLTNEDLSSIPSDAVFAMAGKTDLNALFAAVFQSEGVPAELKMRMAAMSFFIMPLLNAMGDSWVYFKTEDDGVSGGGLVWTLKNPASAKVQLKNLMEMLKNSFQRTEVEIHEMGMNNRVLPFIPTQLDIFGADDEEDVDEPGVQIQVIPGGQIPNGGIPMQVIPGGQLPNGAIPLQVIPGGQLPNGAIPLGGGMFQLGDLIDPALLMSLLPETIEEIKIGQYDFWLLKNGEDNSNNIVIGIVGKKLVVTTKSYAEKYVTFDGTSNISSNESVAKMMSSKPSYLVYSAQQTVPPILKKLAKKYVPGAIEQYCSLVEAFADPEHPVVFSAYSTDDCIRIDAISKMPIPDWLTMSFLYNLGNSLQ